MLGNSVLVLVMACKLYLTRDDRPELGQLELDFLTIGVGVETLSRCPTIYGHPIRNFELLHPTGDMPWRCTLECRDSKTGEPFTYSGIFRD